MQAVKCASFDATRPNPSTGEDRMKYTLIAAALAAATLAACSEDVTPQRNGAASPATTAPAQPAAPAAMAESKDAASPAPAAAQEERKDEPVAAAEGEKKEEGAKQAN
jgi:outer membrane murein-binding lipoprotein Lpp